MELDVNSFDQGLLFSNLIDLIIQSQGVDAVMSWSLQYLY